MKRFVRLLSLALSLCLLCPVGLLSAFAAQPETDAKAVKKLDEARISLLYKNKKGVFKLKKGQKLKLYVRRGDSFISTAAVNAHYVTVTGMDDRWLEVSTWGKKYYINREEFTRYVRKYSCYLFSNLVGIRAR